MCVAASAAPALAQLRPQHQAIVQVAALPQAELHRTVLDDRGETIAGAVVSALGSITAYVESDSEGRFAFRSLSYGPQFLSARTSRTICRCAQLLQIDCASKRLRP